MPAFDPELVALMRTVLDDAMSWVPPGAPISETKALLAEYILKAAAKGCTTYNDLLLAAIDQIEKAISTLS